MIGYDHRETERPQATFMSKDDEVGFNWSDTVVTGEKKGYRMSIVRYSKDFLWIKL